MNKKILVAEDSSVIQNLTRRILTMQNYEIISVKNGAQVLDELNKDRYDLLLLDLNMPVMDGVECAQKIRENDNEQIQKIPIIAITGNAQNLSIQDFHDLGINDYLPKPLNYDDMVVMVNKYLSS